MPRQVAIENSYNAADGSHDDRLERVVEVSGQKDGKTGKKRAAKVAAARNLWIPAVNNAATWGRWGFIEISDPWDAKHAIQSFLAGGRATP